MDIKAERRTCRRFEVPEALVDWRTDPAGPSYGSDAHLGDLSRGGLKFRAPGPPPAGARLRLTLHVPGEPPLELTGQVAWSAVSSGQFHDVGVAFVPFGDEADSNPPVRLERLIAIERRFEGPAAS